MAENAFTQLVGTLRSRGGRRIPVHGPATCDTETSKTSRLRDLIKTSSNGITPLSLAVQIDLEGGTGLVRALLKSDFNAGRVLARDGRYYWNPEYDAEIEHDLKSAIRLLKRHGYQVKKMATDTP